MHNLDRTTLLDQLYRKYTHPHHARPHYRASKKFNFIKRTLDVVISFALLLILSPLILLIAFLIKCQDGGPALYVTKRVGKWGQEFSFPKFRSMQVDAEKMQQSLMSSNKHDSHMTFKMERDPRVTRLGAFLRKTSLDELPQLWNVLIGDMSLVGPRPPLPQEVALYTFEQRKKLEVKPGITCIWQVNGRSELSFPKQLELDLEYIENQSLWLDFKLLLQTIPAIISGQGAY